MNTDYQQRVLQLKELMTTLQHRDWTTEEKQLYGTLAQDRNTTV